MLDHQVTSFNLTSSDDPQCSCVCTGHSKTSWIPFLRKIIVVKIRNFHKKGIRKVLEWSLQLCLVCWFTCLHDFTRSCWPLLTVPRMMFSFYSLQVDVSKNNTSHPSVSFSRTCWTSRSCRSSNKSSRRFSIQSESNFGKKLFLLLSSNSMNLS